MSEFIFHVVSATQAKTALRSGIPANACLSLLSVAKVHAQRLREAGEDVTILAVPYKTVRRSIRPDGLALASPSENGLALSASQVFDAWAATRCRAHDSLVLVGSVRCTSPISPLAITVHEEIPACAMLDEEPKGFVTSWTRSALFAGIIRLMPRGGEDLATA